MHTLNYRMQLPNTIYDTQSWVQLCISKTVENSKGTRENVAAFHGVTSMLSALL